MNRTVMMALVIIFLDAIGIGIIMPVLPALLREFVGKANVAENYGVLLALYAMMQVIFAPLLGRWSDRIGRRPVLLLSLLGATLDYALMATASVVWVLYLGRLIAGITGATGAVAASTIADVTPEESRTHWFGMMGACFGGGMIAGPVIGGFAGQLSVQAPFMFAAAINGLAFLVSLFILHETHNANQVSDEIKNETINETTSSIREMISPLSGLLVVFFIIQLIGQIPATLWVLFGEERFAWDGVMVGVSLAVFGLTHALFQGLAAGFIAKHLGEQRAIVVGILADGCGLLLLAVITQSWMVWPVVLLLACGGITLPALQGIISVRVGQVAQGQLQGLLTSLTHLTGVIGPLIFAFLYSATHESWNGWVWIVGCGLYVVALTILRFFYPGRAAHPKNQSNSQPFL